MRVGNRAQCERRQRAVTRRVIERYRLSVKANVRHVDRGALDTLARQFPSQLGRLDGEHDVDLLGVVFEVETRSKSNLHYSTNESERDLSTPTLHSLRV